MHHSLSTHPQVSSQAAIGAEKAAAPRRDLLMPFLQVVLLLAIASTITIITDALLRTQAWRLTLFLLLWVTVAVMVWYRPRVSARVVDRVRRYFLIIIGPYVLLVLVDALSAVTSGAELFATRSIVLRSLFMLPAMAAICVAAGGGTDLRRGLRALVRPYIYLCLVVSATGLAAWALVQTGAVEPRDWVPPQYLSEKINRKAQEAGGYLYSMPYYLGFVLSGASVQETLGTYQASGLSSEPHPAALFVTPALFLLPFAFPDRKHWAKVLAGLLILAFLAVVYSGTNVLILTTIGVLLMARQLVYGNRYMRPVYIAGLAVFLYFMLTLLGSLLLDLGHAQFIELKLESQSGREFKEFHLSLLESDTLLGHGMFRDSGTAPWGTVPGLLTATTFWLQAAVLAAFGLRLFLSRGDLSLPGLAFLYVAAHSMKDPPHILQFGFYLYILFMAVLAGAASRQEGPVQTRSST